MLFYFSPGACSLADHIALHEAGLAFQLIKVDLKTHTLGDGRDYRAINPKGYVPALQFDDASVLTENVAILSWITDQSQDLAPPGPMGRYRLLEMLSFISGELHKGFKPFFSPGASDDDKAKAGEAIADRLALAARSMKGDYLLGGFSVADAYLFVMARWSKAQGIALAEPLPAWFDRMSQRPAVMLALQHEGQA